MATTRFAPDRGLAARMGLTMFLLGLVYTAFIVALVAVFWRGGGWGFVLLIAAGFLAVQYFFADKIALAAMKGQVVTPEQAPQLHALIDRLCAMANMPKPKVAIANTSLPNAFAIGRTPKKAVVCASTGLMQQLTPEELEGVLAHELSHVAHRDVAVMTIASFLGILAGTFARVGVEIAFWGGLGRDSRDQNAAIAALVVFGMILVSAVVYGISFLLIRALSRYRELAADRSGAMLTGRPSALASALQKVSGSMAHMPVKDLRKQEAYSAFYFAPVKGKGKGFSLASLFSTHPPLETRLEQLAQISNQLGEVMPGQERTQDIGDQWIPGIERPAEQPGIEERPATGYASPDGAAAREPAGEQPFRG